MINYFWARKLFWTLELPSQFRKTQISPASTTSKFAWAENSQCLFQKKMVSKIPLKWMVTRKHEQNLLEFGLVPSRSQIRVSSEVSQITMGFNPKSRSYRMSVTWMGTSMTWMGTPNPGFHFHRPRLLEKRMVLLRFGQGLLRLVLLLMWTIRLTGKRFGSTSLEP